jgi:hypothetical protein
MPSEKQGGLGEAAHELFLFIMVVLRNSRNCVRYLWDDMPNGSEGGRETTD